MDKKIQVFNAYINQFKGDDRYRLKTVHTFHVMENCKTITQDKDPSFQRACQLAGLFHDAGRYEQLKQFGTFLDKDSLDHAELSWKLAGENQWLKGEEFEEQILDAIRRHSQITKRDEPNEILKVLQDADKLDIIRVFCQEPVEEVTGYTEEEARSSIITEEVYESVKRGELVKKADRKAPIDIWMTYLAFGNGLFYDESKKVLAQNDAWKKRYGGHFEDSRVRELVKLQEERLEHENKTRFIGDPEAD